MKKKVISFVAVLAVIISGFVIYASKTYKDPFSKEEYPNSVEKAKKATVEYFKEKKNIDVVIDKVGIIGELGPDTIWVEGHVVENEDQKITAFVQFSETKIVKVSEEVSN